MFKLTTKELKALKKELQDMALLVIDVMNEDEVVALIHLFKIAASRVTKDGANNE